MADEKGMGSIDLMAVISELETELPLWIGKVYQYDRKTFGFRLNGNEGLRLFFIAEAGRRAHLVDGLPPSPKEPPMFAMLLRKYLTGGRVLAIRQRGVERVFSIDIGKSESVFHLIFELYGEGNVILCDGDYNIIKPLWHHRFRTREIVPGAVYSWKGGPEKFPDRERFGEILASSGKDLVRTLATGLMTGGIYAEEICKRSGSDKSGPSDMADPDRVYGAYRELLVSAIEEPHPAIYDGFCSPVKLSGRTPSGTFESFNRALEFIYPMTFAEITKEKERPKLSREEKIRQQQAEAIKSFEEKINKNEHSAGLIYENYQFVSGIIETLREAGSRISWQEIEKTLMSSDLPEAEKIKRVHPDRASVDLDLGVPVEIFVNESLENNVGRYYGLVKKFKKKRDGALKAMEKPLHKKAPSGRKAIAPRKKKWYHRFRWFYTSDGVLAIGGRDADQNEELVKKYMEGKDSFFHADVHGASVVIVKGETNHPEEVAVFAASYSNAWKVGHFTADVYSARPDQVSKTPESGEYVAKGSFVIRGERRYYRDIPLGVSIGIQMEPETGVIGGPETVVNGRAKYSVSIKPGRFEPNDIAKKILRHFRQAFPETGTKEFKNILTSEEIATFVPPGGSEIEET